MILDDMGWTYMARKGSGFTETCVALSMLFHVVWLAVALFLFLGGPFELPQSAVSTWVGHLFCNGCLGSYDAINVASQMGRLDLIALSLTVLGTILAFGALAGFSLIRGAAIQAASDEATAHISARLPQLLTSEIVADAILKDDRVRLSLISAMRSADCPENQIAAATADEIAASFDNEV